jgi:serine/threonine kinase 38
MLRRGQVEYVKAERNVLAEVHNPFIVKLYYSSQVRLAAVGGG